MPNLGPYNWHTGSMQIVWRDPDTGKLHGVTDPRRLGEIDQQDISVIASELTLVLPTGPMLHVGHARMN